MTASLSSFVLTSILSTTLAAFATAQTPYQEDFESLTAGPLAGQGGWSVPSGGSATIVDTGMPAFGDRSLQYDPPGQLRGGFTERLRSPDLGNGSGTLSFDCLVSPGAGTYELALFDDSSSLYFLHLRLDPTGLITVRQSVGTGLFNFTLTSGTWAPNTPMRLGLELFNNENSIRIHKDGAVIFSGTSLAASSFSATGMDAFVVLQSVGPVGNAAMTLDNFDYSPCLDAASYCQAAPNSTGQAAQLFALGSTSISGNDLGYFVASAPASSFGFLYYGRTQIQAPYGDGFRCVGGGGIGIFRVAPLRQLSASNLPFSSGGTLSASLDLTSGPFASGPGMITSGSSWNFQFVFRDLGVSGPTLNTTNALSITFCP